MTVTDVERVLRQVLADEHLRILAALTRTTGDPDLAEDVLQDAAERALTTWPSAGLPDNPAAWLTTVARNRAIDLIRRQGRESELLKGHVAQDLPPATDPAVPSWPSETDDQLAMVITCVHPTLPVADRIALTLKLVNGLTTRDLACLFRVSEATMGQRLLRARRRAREDVTFPSTTPHLSSRLADVLIVVYLTYTGGYLPLNDDGLSAELAEEGVFLARHVAALLPTHADTQALSALVQLLHSHRPARMGGAGELIPLDEQDRSLWNKALIASGLRALDKARRLEPDDTTVSSYRAQAEIAALHTAPSDAEHVDWASILRWYDGLTRSDPAPGPALARVFALAMTVGPAAALIELEGCPAEVKAHPQADAVRADLLRRDHQWDAAVDAYRKALEAESHRGVRAFYERRLSEIQARRTEP